MKSFSRTQSRRTKSQLNRSALLTASFKNHEYAVQYGLIDYVDVANDTAQWLAMQRNLYLDVFDPLEKHDDSILDGLSISTEPHFKAPPTVHARVRLHRDIPKVQRAIGYLYLARDDVENLEPLFGKIGSGCAIIGRVSRIQRLLSATGLKVQPHYYWSDLAVVQIATE